MYKFFRISFAILAAIAVASSILLGIFLGIIYFIIVVALAIFFFGLCILFKQLHERQENKKNPLPTDNTLYDNTNLDSTTTQLMQEILSLQQNTIDTEIKITENSDNQSTISSDKQKNSSNH